MKTILVYAVPEDLIAVNRLYIEGLQAAVKRMALPAEPIGVEAGDEHEDGRARLYFQRPDDIETFDFGLIADAVKFQNMLMVGGKVFS